MVATTITDLVTVVSSFLIRSVCQRAGLSSTPVGYCFNLYGTNLVHL